MVLAADSSSYPALGVFWSIFIFFLWVIWIWILISIFIDIFRSHDLSGFAKALWVLFVLFLPMIGVLVYLIARGGKMHERAVRQARRQDQQARAYIQEAAGPESSADQLAKLADLRDKGVITPGGVRPREGQGPGLSGRVPAVSPERRADARRRRRLRGGHRAGGAPGQVAGQAAQGHVDVHQGGGAARRRLRQVSRGQGVAAQVRVASGDAGGQLGHLRGDLGYFQRHRGRAVQGGRNPLAPLAAVPLPGQLVGVEHRAVGGRVLVGEPGRPVAQLVRPLGHVRGGRELRLGEPRRHGDQPRRQRAGHGGRAAAAGGRHPGGQQFQEVPDRLVEERARRRAGPRVGGWRRVQDSPSICPSASRSMRAAAGLVPSPGMVRMSPQMG